MSESSNNNMIEIKVQTKDLTHALGFANSVVEKRNVMSELSNIKITAKNGVLEIGATDMDLYLNQTIGAEVISEGVTTVCAKTIFEIVRKIPDEEITIKQIAASDQIEIVGKRCRFELLTLKSEQFPQMDNSDFESSLTVSCDEFVRIVEYTNFAMSSEETRYNLNGIYLHVADGVLSSVATDGHRLSVAKSLLGNQLNQEGVKDFGVIVPRKTVNELLKMIRDSKNSHSEIQISLAANKIKFVRDNVILVSKLVDGVFPDYSDFIPSENESKLVVNRSSLAKAIDRVATVTVDKFRAIKMSIDDSVAITASGEAKGAANEKIEFSEEESNYCNYSGSNVSIGFNPKYISDVLDALNEDKVEIYLKDGFSPVLIKTLKNTDDSFVVMPVKV